MEDKITISVRDIPEELWWQAKAEAATRKLSIRDFIISLLQQAVREEIMKKDLWSYPSFKDAMVIYNREKQLGRWTLSTPFEKDGQWHMVILF